MKTHDEDRNKALSNNLEHITRIDANPETFTIGEVWKDYLTASHLGWRLFVRDISAQFRQSYFGYIWAFVPAITTGIVLSIASRYKVINFGETQIPYTAYVIIGMVIWQTFIEALMIQINTIIKSKDMIAKINFPREALIISGFLLTAFNLVIKILLVVAVLLWFHIFPSAVSLMSLFVIGALLLLGSGVGIFLAPFAALYQDIGRFVTIASMALLTITPAFYSPPSEGLFAKVISLNPVATLLVTSRDLITSSEINCSINSIMFAFIIAILTFIASTITYRLSMPFIIERING